MEFITLDKENLEREHICCAISNNKDCQVAAKKAWLAARLDEGLVFRKADARGKCFIEYIPAEKAWSPIAADGYMHIDCLWVSGQFKGQGYAGQLLEHCIADSRAKGKLGLTILSSPKKLSFLADPKFLRYKGFQPADSAAPHFELMYLPFDEAAAKPAFRACAKQPQIAEQGFVLYYSQQCPFTAKYVPLLVAAAESHGAPCRAIRLDSAEQAQNAPVAVTSFALFYNGKFVTHEIPSVPKFEKLLAAEGF